jgi:hypothetical protein
VDWLPVAVGALYLLASAGYWRGGQSGWALAYLAYAVANGGLVLAAIQGRHAS